MTTVNSQMGEVAAPPERTPLAVYLSAAWNLVVVAACVWLSVYIFQLEDFGRLGRPVQYFMAVLVLVPAVLGVYSSVTLLQRKPGGRYSALAIQYVGLVLSIIAVLSAWGVWNSFEYIVDGILGNVWVMWGFAIAYVLNWLAGRFEGSLGDTFQTLALAVASLALIVILWFSGLLDGISYILGVYADFSGAGFWSPGLTAWTATLLVLVFGALAYAMLNLGVYFGETPFEREAWQGWLLLSPNIIGFAIFFAGPLLLSFYLSFTDSTVGAIPNVIGLQNYFDIFALEWLAVGGAANAQDVLTIGYAPLWEPTFFGTEYVLGAQDTLFWISLRNTLVFCAVLVPLATAPAIGLAMILNSTLPGMKIFRALYFLPSVAAVVGTATIWRWLYNPTVGFINDTISQFVNFLQGLGISATDPAIQWLSDPDVVLISIVLLAAWQVVGFNTVLFLAGLQGIPKVLYEAAMVDGAGAWSRFRSVTLPMLGPTTFFVIITTIITGLQVFNEPYTLFVNQQPIPQDATTSVYYLYRRGFFFFEFGYASAVAWVLFVIIFAITFMQFRLQNANAYE